MRKPFESGYWLYAKHDAGKQELTLHCSSIWAHTYATQIALRSIWANNALMEWTTDVRTAKDFPPLNVIQDDNTWGRLVCIIKNLSLTLNFNISSNLRQLSISLNKLLSMELKWNPESFGWYPKLFHIVKLSDVFRLLCSTAGRTLLTRLNPNISWTEMGAVQDNARLQIWEYNFSPQNCMKFCFKSTKKLYPNEKNSKSRPSNTAEICNL